MDRTIDSRLMWQVAAFAVPLIALYIFLQDIIAPQWPAWILTPSLVFGFHAAVSRIDEGSFARAILWQLALIAVAFAAVYNLFDVVIHPDWPLWIIAPAVVVGTWIALFFAAGVMDEA